jgi:low affinity Fe/Cu permease
MREAATELARRAPGVIGSSGAFLLLSVMTVGWALSGFYTGFSDAWLLVPSAVASIVALLLVVLLQYSQNRDTRALQLKLDELIRAVGDSRDHFVRLEQLNDAEIAHIAAEFDRLRERSLAEESASYDPDD